MAAHLTFPSTRQTRSSWFPSITGITALASTILEGLGEFGLAANGMCPTSPEQALSSPGQNTTAVNTPRQ